MTRRPDTSGPERARLPPEVLDALADALATALVRDLQQDADALGGSVRGTHHTGDADGVCARQAPAAPCAARVGTDDRAHEDTRVSPVRITTTRRGG